MEEGLIILRLIAALALLGLTSSKLTVQSDALDSTKDFLEGRAVVVSPPGIWSQWGPWAPCSRSCGGGVAVQTRKCLPPTADNRNRGGRRRRRTSPLQVLAPPPDMPMRSHTLTREGNSTHRCQGLDKRYHECNTLPCPGPPKDFRQEQCTSFNRRPFKGRFYVWTPYIDVKNPCLLNCRPMGRDFYATLATAIDGTKCDKPGFRAVCVQAQCKALGLDGVVSSWGSPPPGQAACGSRLVTGLFTRDQLPLGYTLLTTIPAGACRINVTEMHNSNNYLALKATNGSFVINGNFAISWPGEYEAAGSRFLYRRQSGSIVESISAPGPLTHPVDIMILYQHPNPGIKYEYTEAPDPVPSASPNQRPALPSSPGHNASISRHHFHPRTRVDQDDNSITTNIDPRSKRDPVSIPEVDGNGIEQRAPPRPAQERYPYGVLATESEKPIPPNHPAPRHRRKKFVWQVTKYSPCSKPCAGVQTGVLACVRDYNQAPAPERRCGARPAGGAGGAGGRACGGACPARWAAGPWGACSSSCGPATQHRALACRQDVAFSALNVKVSDSVCSDTPPAASQPCLLPACPELIRQDDRLRNRERDETDRFSDSVAPPLVRHTNESQTRSPDRRDELSNEIGGNENPRTTRGHWKPSNAWIYSDWTQECSDECGKGVLTRSVRCADPSGCDDRRRPEDTRVCSSDRNCATQASKWFSGPWSPCSNPCAINGRMSREVVCMTYSRGQYRPAATCPGHAKPDTERPCPPSVLRADCGPEWFIGDWSQCLGPCGSTQQMRMVTCQGSSGGPEGSCAAPRPPHRRDCVPSHCHLNGFTPRPDVQKDSENSLDTLSDEGECVDKIPACHLAVQARLCRYKYYAASCCKSCRKAQTTL